jgi:hypothetical protein
MDGAFQQVNISFYNMQAKARTLDIGHIFSSEKGREQMSLIRL